MNLDAPARFAVGSHVRITRRPWTCVVLEIDTIGPAVHQRRYRIIPVCAHPHETSYWWAEWDLEPASLLDALAEAALDSPLQVG